VRCQGWTVSSIYLLFPKREYLFQFRDPNNREVDFLIENSVTGSRQMGRKGEWGSWGGAPPLCAHFNSCLYVPQGVRRPTCTGDFR